MVAHARHRAPLDLLHTTVAAEWIDYNGHMNDAAYAVVFSRSVDALMDRIGLDAGARRRTGRTLYTMQTMLRYFREAKEGEALAVSGQLLEHDNKRMRVWLEMSSASGDRLAASEQLLLSVEQSNAAAKAEPWSFETRSALDALAHLHGAIPHPAEAGAGVTMRRKT